MKRAYLISFVVRSVDNADRIMSAYVYSGIDVQTVPGLNTVKQTIAKSGLVMSNAYPAVHIIACQLLNDSPESCEEQLSQLIEVRELVKYETGLPCQFRDPVIDLEKQVMY